MDAAAVPASGIVENDIGHPEPMPTGMLPGLFPGPPEIFMHTLPPPIRLSFACSDRIGTDVVADVTATQESGFKPWVWRAVFHGTGEPPAELMGASETSEQIEADVCARVRNLQMIGVIVPSIELVSPAEGAAAEVADVLRVASALDADEQRRANLMLIVKELGADGIVGLTLAAKVLGTREAALRDMLNGGDISDAVARNIEWVAHKPLGWMDWEHELESMP
jgi:hypothetical protein